MRHKSCTLFLFFQIIRQNAVNDSDGFQYLVFSAIILQLARWSSYNTAATWAMFSFVFVVPSLLLHSASSIDYSPTANQLFHRNTVTHDWLFQWNTVAHDADESLNAFTNISQVFAAVNPTLQQNFIVAHCSKFLSMVIYNRSTEHTILQNALILSHMDGFTSNLVCRWRRV